MEALADAAKISDMEEQLKNKPWYIINPESTGMNLWDIVTALALIFTALVTPFNPDGSIDWDSFKALVQSNIDAGLRYRVMATKTA